ncbi:MAG: methylmalonyl-CoA epimerase [Candidatus Eisenbacteria sp.]|nr:methylmalonyl-CoA epimerase [Candidatus Eisenbacteria bacterium]
MINLIEKIDHIGIAVADAEASLAIFRDALGLELVRTEPVASQKLVSYHLRIGASNLELLSPTEPGSVIATFLEKKGQGIHHLALAVRDIEEVLAHLKAKGLQPLSEKPTEGAGGKRVIFFHPRTTGGVLLELCETVAR